MSRNELNHARQRHFADALLEGVFFAEVGHVVVRPRNRRDTEFDFSHFEASQKILCSSFVVVAEIAFNLLKRTTFGFGHELDNEQQAEQSDSREVSRGTAH